MGTSKMPKEYLVDISERLKNANRMYAKMKEDILSRSKMHGITNGKSVEFFYPEEVQKLIDQIEQERVNYIHASFPEEYIKQLPLSPDHL
jgi:uncharacterized protein YwqG